MDNMNKFCVLILLLINNSAFGQTKALPAPSEVGQMGSVYRPPIKVGSHLYILASSGTLFKTDLNLKNQMPLFQTEKKTFSGILRDKNILYFGDGLHHDKASFFYAYDLVKNKIVFKLPVKGHIEKFPIKYKKNIIFSAGIGGLISIDAKSGKVMWKITKDLTKSLHIDATPIIKGSTLYFSSIYNHKALLCADADHGKLTCSHPTKLGVANDILDYGKYLVSFHTTARSTTKKYETPTLLKIFDIEQKKYIKEIKLRGFNFFINKSRENQINLATSSGDIIRVEVPSGKVSYLDQHPEPYMSSSFRLDDNDCFFSTMGRFSCYNSAHKRVTESRDVLRAAIGDISKIDGKFYIPTRIGMLIFNPKLKKSL
jgi:hypothetical protein